MIVNYNQVNLAIEGSATELYKIQGLEWKFSYSERK